MCECEGNRSMDIKTPRNVHLSGFYKRYKYDILKYMSGLDFFTGAMPFIL